MNGSDCVPGDANASILAPEIRVTAANKTTPIIIFDFIGNYPPSAAFVYINTKVVYWQLMTVFAAYGSIAVISLAVTEYSPYSSAHISPASPWR